MKTSDLMTIFALGNFGIGHCANNTSPLLDVNGTAPVHYGILVFPGFQALDVYGPLDILNMVSSVYPYPMRLTVLGATRDPASTHVKSNTSKKHTLTRFEQRTIIDRTLDEQLAFQEAIPTSPLAAQEKIDVLIVPGGSGTRQNVTAEIEFMKRIYPSLKQVLSICTGASILARAGVLDGRRATTNKRSWSWTTSTGPNVTWVGEARWVVDGNIITSSGISAGMDATYAFVGRHYGREVEERIAAGAEYARYVNPNYDPFSHVWNVTQPYNSTVPVIGL